MGTVPLYTVFEACNILVEGFLSDLVFKINHVFCKGSPFLNQFVTVREFNLHSCGACCKLGNLGQNLIYAEQQSLTVGGICKKGAENTVSPAI